MENVTQIKIGTRPFNDFARVVGESRVAELEMLVAPLRDRIGGHALWNINSTATGGGVAEMLQSILPYVRGAGIDARWAVLRGDPDFFRVTKRLHNALHGWPGDGSPLDKEEHNIYEARLRQVGSELVQLIQPGDVVLLHDPQTAGLVRYAAEANALAIWRCHIGEESRSREAARGWAFLAPYLEKAHAFVFSRKGYIPDFCNNGRSVVIPPSIDAFSTKNQPMDQKVVRAVLARAGIISGGSNGEPARFFSAKDQVEKQITRAAQLVTASGPPAPDTPLVVQVSRWDTLKDPVGVLRGFAAMFASEQVNGANLILAGPDVSAVADDPEGAAVLDHVTDEWRSLPEGARHRIHLALLPMVDLEENAAMVNALQRHASIVVQKSLQEGFGLTVTEAMWKAKAVVASAVGGIRDQIVDGIHGLLVSDPSDLTSFGRALAHLLRDPQMCRQLGENAHKRVRDEFLGIRHLIQYGRLLLDLGNGRHPGRQ